MHDSFARRVLVALTVTCAGCGASSGEGGQARRTPDEQFADICQQIQGSGCSPYDEVQVCATTFRRERENASQAGCEAEYLTLVSCRERHGFRCQSGRLLWNSGCEGTQSDVASCVDAHD